jgi:aspartyl aminopeptidase
MVIEVHITIQKSAKNSVIPAQVGMAALVVQSVVIVMVHIHAPTMVLKPSIVVVVPAEVTDCATPYIGSVHTDHWQIVTKRTG